MSDERVIKSLFDIARSAEEIASFVEGMEFSEYASDVKTQRAVERGFEIIGEALNRIKRENPEILERVTAQHEIIGFRNILAHGYDQVDERIVWKAITLHLPKLKEDVEALLTQ